MGVIIKTWNDFPAAARKNLVHYYLDEDRLKQMGSNGSIYQNIWIDYDLLWFTPIEDRGKMSYLEFTEEQYAMFLLRWL